jgi:serine/threonine protein kinase
MTEPKSAAHQLTGIVLKGRWTVIGFHRAGDNDSGGAFSVGYEVRDEGGNIAFLKALDYAEALADSDVSTAIKVVADTYLAERDLLRQCGAQRLSRIVRALDDGQHRLSDKPQDVVSFLIFEWADGGDARDSISVADPADPAPMLRLAHNAAVALEQLHSIKVSHQDVKPSNILVWNSDSGPIGKLGDLGRAHVEGRSAPHDEYVFAGDRTYAAPEYLYRADERLPLKFRRYASDMHMLGSLICFLLVARSYNALLYGILDGSLHWRAHEGSYDAVLPGLINAHDLVLTRLAEVLPVVCAEKVVKLIGELCHPDPLLRGDPEAHKLRQNPYQLHRFVSRLDLIQKRTAIAMRLVD